MNRYVDAKLKWFLLPVFVFSLFTTASGQFRSPVSFPLRLSGSFGELRKNHFHTGVDIKKSSKYKQNKIFAVDSGYIYRIKVSADGYGKALYIAHPNGITSVYAHMSKFNRALEDTVKKMQYANMTFELDPDTLHIPVAKGQFLGYMGNTGRSFGPHLHFELRNTVTEHPVNPFAYHIKSKDNIPPVLSQVKLVALDTSFNVLNAKIYNLHKSKNSTYITVPSHIAYGAWRIGVEISGFDRMNGAYNKNGIYNIIMKVDGEEVFGFTMDSLDFDRMNEINAFIDYKEYKNKKKRFIRLYRLPGLDLDILHGNNRNGVIPLFKNKEHKVEIIAGDYDGNKSYATFYVKRATDIVESSPRLYNHLIKYNTAALLQGDGYLIKIDKDALFKDMYLYIKKKENGEISIFTNYEPFKKSIRLMVKVDTNISNAKKLCLVKLDNKKNIKLTTHIDNGYLTAGIKESGVFKPVFDTVPPVIKPMNFRYNLKNIPVIKFKISDNYASGGKAGKLKYRGFIDDNWVLFEYDKKKRILSHRFDNSMKRGKHILKLVVEDDNGNVNIFEKPFLK